MKKYFKLGLLGLIIFSSLSSASPQGEESLFKPEMVNSPLVQKMFSFIEKNREKIIEEWIYLTEIPAPSGHEEKRADYLKKQFEATGLDEVVIDTSGNVIGIWKGTGRGKRIIMSAHMDTVFQGVWEIKVKREGNLLKAPGIGDDTANLANLAFDFLPQVEKFPFASQPYYFYIGEVRAVVSKRGVDDGNQKGGGSLQPAKKNQYNYTIKNINVKKKVENFKFFFKFYLDIVACFL